MMKNTLVILFVSILMVGCGGRPIVMSDEDLSKRETPELNKLRYGYTLNEVKRKTGDSGKLIFRFLANGNEYEVYIVELRKFNNAYCLLFNNGRLRNIFGAENGISKWRSVFGKQDGSIPNGYQIPEILQELSELKINPVAYDFTKEGNIEYKYDHEYVYEYNYTQHEAGVEGTLMEAGIGFGMIWPSLFKVAGAAFIYMIAEGGYKSLNDNVSQSQLEYIKSSYDRYLTILDITRDIPLKTSMSDVRRELGIESRFIIKKYSNTYEEMVLIYQPLFGVALGFNGNKELVWIAYDYDPDLSFKEI